MTFTFDPPETGYALTGFAQIWDAQGAHSAPNALYLFARAFIDLGHPAVTSDCVWTVAVAKDEAASISLWTDGDSAGPTRLQAQITDGISTWEWELTTSPGPGWQFRQLGIFTPAASAITVRIHNPEAPASGSGFWLVDDVTIDQPGGPDMKLPEIEDALVAAIRTVTVANGYAVDVKEVVTRPAFVPSDVNDYIHVQLINGEESKEVDAYQTKRCVVSYSLVVVAQQTETMPAPRQALIACGEIEKAIERFDAGKWLGLGYVQNVFVSAGHPETLTDSMEGGVIARTLTADVSYVHARRDP